MHVCTSGGVWDVYIAIKEEKKRVIARQRMKVKINDSAGMRAVGLEMPDTSCVSIAANHYQGSPRLAGGHLRRQFGETVPREKERVRGGEEESIGGVSR